MCILFHWITLGWFCHFRHLIMIQMQRPRIKWIMNRYRICYRRGTLNIIQDCLCWNTISLLFQGWSTGWFSRFLLFFFFIWHLKYWSQRFWRPTRFLISLFTRSKSRREFIKLFIKWSRSRMRLNFIFFIYFRIRRGKFFCNFSNIFSFFNRRCSFKCITGFRHMFKSCS